MDTANPYAPPTTDLARRPESDRPGIDPELVQRGRLVWLVLFCLKMFVPVLFATSVVTALGWVGLVAAALLLAWGGFALLAAHPRWTSVAVAGAATLAATQFLPVLQVITGMIGLGIVGGVRRIESTSAQLSILQAFGATCVTGMLLLTASIVCGGFFLAIGLVGRTDYERIGEDRSFDRLHDLRHDA